MSARCACLYKALIVDPWGQTIKFVGIATRYVVENGTPSYQNHALNHDRGTNATPGLIRVILPYYGKGSFIYFILRTLRRTYESGSPVLFSQTSCIHFSLVYLHFKVIIIYPDFRRSFYKSFLFRQSRHFSLFACCLIVNCGYQPTHRAAKTRIKHGYIDTLGCNKPSGFDSSGSVLPCRDRPIYCHPLEYLSCSLW